jgi:hypothetical protein
MQRRRPADASDELVEAVGKASEAMEYVERARGRLYDFHQLMGRADLLFGDAAERLRAAGAATEADELSTDVVGRNVLDGRWSFQIVEEFDDLYWGFVRERVRRIEQRHMDGVRHVHESELKERERTNGHDGHEARPPRAHDDRVETSTDA